MKAEGLGLNTPRLMWAPKMGQGPKGVSSETNAGRNMLSCVLASHVDSVLWRQV